MFEFAERVTINQSRTQGNGSGLLGLAFSTINTVSPTPQKTPVDNIIAQKTAKEQLFTAYLGSWRDTDEADKGEVNGTQPIVLIWLIPVLELLHVRLHRPRRSESLGRLIAQLRGR